MTFKKTASTLLFLAAVLLIDKESFAAELVFSGNLKCEDAFCSVTSKPDSIGAEKIVVTGLPTGSMTRYDGVDVVIEGTDVGTYRSVRRIQVKRIRPATEAERYEGKLKSF